MLNVDIKANLNIEKATKKIQKKLDRLANDSIDKFKDLTPINTGNAKRNTKLKGDAIEANYPYAEVLDKGRHMTNRGMRGSTQAPKGMSQPFFKWLNKKVKQIFRK